MGIGLHKQDERRGRNSGELRRANAGRRGGALGVLCRECVDCVRSEGCVRDPLIASQSDAAVRRP